MLKNKKGITLVELLIVVVILGIIAAISIPAVGNVVRNAEKDAVIADAQNLRSAANLCVTSGDCSFTNSAFYHHRAENVGGADSYDWIFFNSDQLGDYIDIDDEVDYYVIFSNEDNGFSFEKVAIDFGDGNWYYIGDPRDALRTNVVASEGDELADPTSFDLDDWADTSE